MIVLRKKVVNKLVARWAASFLSVLLLMSMVALPALAAVAANSVNSSSIVDGSIKTRDIKRNAITTSRIKNHTIRKEDIHSGSINKYKLTSGSVNTYKILDGSIKDADISGSAAIDDSKIGYSTKTRHFSIAPGTLWPGGAASDGSFLTPPGPNMIAPVNLPDGAKVTNLLLAAYDNGPTDTTAKLMRTDRSENADTLVSVKTTGTGPNPREFSSSTVTNPVIDNAKYSYYVLITTSGAGMRLDGIFITYQVTGP